MRRRTPVLVLAGFLGSGKTTVLNHVLAHSLDQRIGVIVNDFGSIPVDAMLVGGSAAGVVPVGNGCLCCVADEAGVGPMLDRLTAPDADIDAIVIEASGIAEPGALVRLVLGSRNPHTVLGGLIEVVDAVEFENIRRRHPELDRHVRLADLVVVTKADRVDDARLAWVQDVCRSLNPRAPLLVARHGVVEPRMLFDIDVVPGRQLMLGQADCGSGHVDGEHDHRDHLHAAYAASRSSRSDRSTPPASSSSCSAARRRPTGSRASCTSGCGATGSDSSSTRSVSTCASDRGPWPVGERRCTSLVVIGCGMDQDAILDELRACEREDPAEPEAMFAVHRHTHSSASASRTA